jgi:hypothetical protein
MPQLKHFLAVTGAWLAAALCGALAAWLAWLHPLSPTAAMLGCAIAAALTALWPTRWPWWIFPVLPLLGLAQWTGSLAIEEVDLLVLSVAAAGYVRLALHAPHTRGSTPVISTAWWWLMPLLLALVVGLWRALEAVGEQPLLWWQGYREPLNSLRLGKSLLEAMLLLPLARAAWIEDQALASSRLTTALVWLLLITGLGLLWDRASLGGLPEVLDGLRQSTLFWEAQSGGDAVAAVLALTLPFAAMALSQARNWRQAVLPALGLLLGLQACTSGRSTLALPAAVLGLALWWWLLVRQQRAAATGLVPAVLAGVLVLAATMWLFPVTGPAGPMAVVAAMALMLPLQGLRGRLDQTLLIWSLVGGALAALALAGAAWLLPRLAVPLFAAVWLCGLAMLAWVWAQGRPLGVMVALAATMALLGGVVAVALFAGGRPAALRAAPVALLLALIFCTVALRRTTSWPDDQRWQGRMLVPLAAMALLGAWLIAQSPASRLAALDATLSTRAAHWRATLATLESPLDWAFGKGLGRFPALHALNNQAPEQGGDIRWLPYEEGGVVQLSSGRRSSGEGTRLQLAQHVPAPQAAAGGAPAAVLRVTVRSSDRTAGLRAQLCAASCWAGVLQLDPATRPGQWQTLELRLAGPGAAPAVGAALRQRPPVFALGAEPANVRVQIDKLSLIDADGRGAELLNNGGFEAGLAHWYAVGEPGYTPWHLQNAAVHLLFEQGLLGLLAWLGAFGLALWRLVFGVARQRSLAPPLAGALLALAVVGSQDSLFDMPRVAFVGSLLLAVALGIADHRQHRRRRGRKTRA